ncbi:MAG: hypothetical protein AAGJ18_26220, partial [Bacteroidota bacterium]
MRFLLIVYMLLVLGQYLAAQEDGTNREKATPENFTWAMTIEKANLEELNVINGLVHQYRITNKDTFHILAKHAVDVSQHLKQHTSHGLSLRRFAASHNLRNDFTNAIHLFEEAAEIFKLNGENNRFAGAMLSIGQVLVDKQDYREGIKRIIQASEMLLELRDTSRSIQANLSLGDAFEKMGQYSKAKKYQKISLQLAIDSKNKMMRMYSLGELGKSGRSTLVALENKIEKDTQPNPILIDSLLKTAEETKAYASQSYELAVEVNQVSHQGYVLPFLMDAEKSLGNFSTALAYGKQIENLIPKVGYKEMEVAYYLDMAEIYYEMTNLPKAKNYVQKAYEEHTSKIDITYFAIQYMRYSIYKDLGKYKEALLSAEDYFDFEMSRLDKVNSKAINDLETQYQTAQKEREILQQRNDILELETANAAVVKQRNYLFGGSILLAMLTFFGYQLNKTRRERNDKIAFADALMYA